MSVVCGGVSWRCQVGVAVASGLFLCETRPAEELEDQTSQRHEDGHPDAQSDDGRHVRLQPRTVRLYSANPTATAAPAKKNIFLNI